MINIHLSLHQAKHYKFGILFQKQNQFTEEDIFGNNVSSPEFDKFLSSLGDKVQLRGHQGYSGGLDTRHDQTGTVSVYTEYHDVEIMFHVGIYLPYRSDPDLKV